MFSTVGLIIAGLFLSWVAVFVWLVRRDGKATKDASDVNRLRSRAITMWCEVNQKIRNKEARMEDLEMSFFLDDVIARPHCYRIDDKGVFHRK
jgi:hypothetical protein